MGASHPVNIKDREEGNPKQIIKANTIQKAAEIPLPYDFAAVNGLRVIACLAVICFHSLLYWGALLEVDEGRKVSINSDKIILFG